MKLITQKISYLVAVFFTCFFTINFAFAKIDVNQADENQLQTINGIGPAMSKRIIEERSAQGPFKDWGDFESRVKGVGEKTSEKFAQAGLTIDGKGKNSTSVEKLPPAKAKSRT